MSIWGERSEIFGSPRKIFLDSLRQYLPIAIEGLWGIIAIICVRIFVRYFVKSFDKNTALKRLSINGHFFEFERVTPPKFY